jgi:hypothetical protein
MVDFVIFTTMREEQLIYRKLYDKYGSVLSPYGVPAGQPIEEDRRVSSLGIDNCQYVIVCDTHIHGIPKMVIAPDIIIGANNTYEVVADKNSKIKLFSLQDYKSYNYDEYDKMCKQIDYILYRKKELDIERKINRINKDF